LAKPSHLISATELQIFFSSVNGDPTDWQRDAQGTTVAYDNFPLTLLWHLSFSSYVLFHFNHPAFI